MVCNRAVNWWDEVEEASDTRGTRNARYTSNTAGSEEYAIARNKVKEMVEKGIWKHAVSKTNEGFDGGIKQMRVGIIGILGEQVEVAATGIATLRAQNGKMVM